MTCEQAHVAVLTAWFGSRLHAHPPRMHWSLTGCIPSEGFIYSTTVHMHKMGAFGVYTVSKDEESTYLVHKKHNVRRMRRYALRTFGVAVLAVAAFALAAYLTLKDMGVDENTFKNDDGSPSAEVCPCAHHATFYNICTKSRNI